MVSAADILDLLPQTQCTRCGYPDCAGYAQAIARGEADINQCPPGGAEGVARLASLTGRPALPLNPANGLEGARGVAWIDEAWCIGCTLCMPVCPTDAIVGTNKRMHTVIEAWCTGCELCLPACPVDCIRMEPVSGSATGWDAWSATQAEQARERHAFGLERRRRAADEQAQRQQEKARGKLADLASHSLHTDPVVLERKRAVIAQAIERARQRRETGSS